MVNNIKNVHPDCREIPDYVVSTISGNVILCSGLDGQMIEQSADASAIIQRAIDLLPLHGGNVYISAGEYMLNETIRIVDKHGVHLQGAARGIWQYYPVGKKQGTVLRSEKDIDLVEVFGENIRIAGITISNLYVVGSGKTNGKAGILVRGNMDLCTFYNVGANNCGIGFHFQDDCPMMADYSIDAPQVYFCDPQQNGIGMRIEQAHYLKVVGGEFSDNSEYGIFISGKNWKSIISPKISSITAVRNTKGGIFIGKCTEDVTITGGTDAAGSSAGSGVIITGEGTKNIPVNVIVSQIHAYNNSQCGILVESGKNIIIQGCICSVHDHVWINIIPQQFGVKICKEAANVVVNGCITYGNALGEIVDQSVNLRPEELGDVSHGTRPLNWY